MSRQYVGIDFHRQRSFVIRKDADGTVLAKERITNSPANLARVVDDAGDRPEVIIEAAYGWYWAVDLLQALDCDVHLAAPSGLNWGNRRVKNDERDANDLIDLLRVDRLPEAWIAPPATRELRELVRYRAKLVGLRTSMKAQLQAVLAKEGIYPRLGELWGPGGRAELDRLQLAPAYQQRLDSLRTLIATFDREIVALEADIHSRLRGDIGYQAIQKICGVGPIMAAIFVAEIGDVHRFRNAAALASWAGLTPKQHDSDLKERRKGVTKQGSRLLRWAAMESVARYKGGSVLAAKHDAIAERRGKPKARVATARKLLTLVYYGLRDGEVRCLRATTA